MDEHDNYFARPKSLADKAALIVVLINGQLPDYGKTTLDALVWTHMALTDSTKEQAERAFKDAEKFGFIYQSEDEDGE